MQQNKNLLKNDNERWHPLGLRVREGKTDLLFMDNACLCLLSSKLHSAIMIFVFSLIAFQIYATDIATQCPLIGGTAVYLARPMLECMGLELEYNDALTCISQGTGMRASNGSNATNVYLDIKVFPNPANDQINFDFGDAISGELVIYDALGKIVKEIKWINESFIVASTNGLSNGVYRYKIMNSNFENSNKIIILK